MKPSRFTYHAPQQLEVALDLLAEHGDEAKVLAGGQSLLPMLSFRLAAPEQLIDINRLPGLDTVQRTASGWCIPALVRQRFVERSPEMAATVPILAQALEQVAHPQIRNRGTVCGSLAHGDAAAELPAVMLALEATMHVVSRAGERHIDVEDFFVFHLTTAIADDELLLDVTVADLPPRTYSSFQELATRRGDFGIAGVAAVVTVDESGVVIRCRLTAAGVAPTPVRLTGTEQVVLGQLLEPEVIMAAGAAARHEVSPTGDIHADATYRRQLVGVLIQRALRDVITKGSLDNVIGNVPDNVPA
jgi:carbon-monoxide dehydrogenase medium subunit